MVVKVDIRTISEEVAYSIEVPIQVIDCEEETLIVTAPE